MRVLNNSKEKGEQNAHQYYYTRWDAFEGDGRLTHLSHTQFICQIPQIVQTSQFLIVFATHSWALKIQAVVGTAWI